jgi:hypothetical protein
MQRLTETCRERKDTQRDVENHNTSKDYQRLPESFGRASKDTPETFSKTPKDPKDIQGITILPKTPRDIGSSPGYPTLFGRLQIT